MGNIINIRAAEITALREKNRHLRRQLAQIESIADENDAMVALLHRLSLLLIARKNGWRAEAELLLRRGFKAAACHIVVFGRADSVIIKKVARLPAGGCTAKEPINPTNPTTAAAVYYHLPLRRGRKNEGLLTLAMRREADVRAGDDEFCRRLSALLAAAL